MNEHSIKLIEKYADALVEHFGDITDDRLLAFAVNSLLATEGIDDVEVMLEQEGVELKERAEKLLAKSMLKIANKKLTAKSSLASGNGDLNGLTNGAN